MKGKMMWWTATIVMSLMLASGPAQANGIVSIAYDGTGCPQGSVGQSISHDRQSFTLIFDSFIAWTGPDVPDSEEVKECRIALTMQTNESVEISMQARGYVQLPAGMTGDQHQNIPRAKRANQVTLFAGPVSRDYLADSTATVLAQGNPLSTTVTILLQVEIDKGNNVTDPGQLTTDSLDLKIH